MISCVAAVLPAEDPQTKFKNLKVLPKNITEEKLDSIMEAFNYSLGVKCIFCHVRPDSGEELNYVSDAKGEKDIARNMMRMTDNINKKYFNFNKEKTPLQTITCISCHQKKARPPIEFMPRVKEKNKTKS